MKLFIILLPFSFLWYRSIDSVQLEWSTNPQYGYGWVVPMLCLGLVFRNWKLNANLPALHVGGATLNGERSPTSFVSRSIFLLFLVGILLFLPARLVLGATPEWRPLQWILALIAVGSTLYLIFSVWGRSGVLAFGFPVLFFLVAVPWPSPIENPIIQNLTMANAAVVVELLGMFGIPAIQHGNIIEVGSGVVGIDEACSGIRSFQSSLMISLFLGELYRLSKMRRVILLVSGLALSFLFNVCRTFFLTWIAANKGVAAIAQYHDPAGLAILVACTVTLCLLGMYLGRKAEMAAPEPSAISPQPSKIQSLNSVNSPSPVGHSQPSTINHQPSTFSPASISPFGIKLSAIKRLSLALIVWFASVEIGCALWFSIRESKLEIGHGWTMNFPTNEVSFKAIAIGEKTYGLLRYDEGKEGAWTDESGGRWHAFYFNWLPGRVAGYLAKRHTPEACMTGIGQTLRSGPNLFTANVHDITFPIRQYVFESQSGLLHVFHCRWEAGADQTSTLQHETTRFNLLRGIWAGRGKSGQKVFEFIITGYDTQEQARTALLRQLETLVQVESAKKGITN